MKIEDIININSLNERLDGDFELFKELSELFITESVNLLEAVENAVKAKNGEKIGKAAHTIKGAISNFSADRAFYAALALERLGKNNELDKVETAFIDLKKEIEQMQKALSFLMSEGHL